MLLYAIKVKADGSYFSGTYANGKVHYNRTSPQFWKTPDAIVTNLKRLCSDFDPYKTKWGFWEKGWSNFDANKLKLYEVVKFTVLASKQTTLPADEFVSIKDIEKADCDSRRKYAIKIA